MSGDVRFIRKGGKIIPIKPQGYDGKSGKYRDTYTTNRGTEAKRAAGRILKNKKLIKGGKLALGYGTAGAAGYGAYKSFSEGSLEHKVGLGAAAIGAVTTYRNIKNVPQNRRAMNMAMSTRKGKALVGTGLAVGRALDYGLAYGATALLTPNKKKKKN